MNNSAVTSTARVARLRPSQHARPVSADSIVGQVLSADDGVYQLRSGSLTVAARRAASCLLDVAEGDTVQALYLPGEACWILAVMARREGTQSALRLPAGTSIETEDGQLQIAAQDLSLRSRTLKVNAEESVFVSGGTEVIGERFRIVGSTFHMVGKIFHGVMERVSHYSQHYLRTTEGLDRVQSANLELSATQLLRVSGEHTLFEGEKLVKTRGAQIHFG